MSEETRDIWYKNIELVYKLVVTGLLSAIFIKGGAYVEELKTLTFSSVEAKVLTETHMKNTLTELELRDLKGHITNPDYHMPKAVKDSLYVSRSEYNDLIVKQAVTNYQLKEDVSEIKHVLRDIKNRLDR